jgi:hypothetical protein
MVKAFEGGILVDAVSKWVGYGHDPKDIYTVFRYGDLHYPIWERPEGWTMEQAKDFVRVEIPRFIDATWLEKYAPFVDAIETWNEHTDDDMCRNPVRWAPHLLFERAFAEVWRDEWRGRIVPQWCELVQFNAPVGNSTPKEAYALVKEFNNRLGVHTYSRYWDMVREPFDFLYLSGRPFYDEQRYGPQYKCKYAITESGPFADVDAGWRHPRVLRGDIKALVQAEKDFTIDLRTTDAWKRGDIEGPALFTQGHVGWEWYQYEEPELVQCYEMFSEEWWGDIEEALVGMDPARKARIEEKLTIIRDATNAIQVELDAEVPPVPVALFRIQMRLNITVNIRSTPVVQNGPVPPSNDIGDTTPIAIYSVYEVSPGGWYRIDPVAMKWISGDPTYSVRLPQ